jgi:hypothetical protein
MKKPKGSPLIQALNEVRRLWCRIPIKDGKAYTPTLDPELLGTLAPWERKPFENRMLMLANMAGHIIRSTNNPSDIEEAIRQAEQKASA